MCGQNDRVQLHGHHQAVVGDGQRYAVLLHKVGHVGVHVGQDVDEVADHQQKDAQLKDANEVRAQLQQATLTTQQNPLVLRKLLPLLLQLLHAGQDEQQSTEDTVAKDTAHMLHIELQPVGRQLWPGQARGVVLQEGHVAKQFVQREQQLAPQQQRGQPTELRPALQVRQAGKHLGEPMALPEVHTQQCQWNAHVASHGGQCDVPKERWRLHIGGIVQRDTLAHQ